MEPIDGFAEILRALEDAAASAASVLGQWTTADESAEREGLAIAKLAHYRQRQPRRQRHVIVMS